MILADQTEVGVRDVKLTIWFLLMKAVFFYAKLKFVKISINDLYKLIYKLVILIHF